MKVENFFFNEIKNEKFENSLIFVFTSEIDKVKEIMNTLNENSKNCNIILATTDGEVFDNLITNSTVVTVINFEKTEVEAYYCYQHESFKMGEKIARKFSKKPDLIISIGDGIQTNGEEYLKGIYSVFPDVKLSGGMAADNGRLEKTFIGLNGEIYSKGAVAIGLFNKDLKVELVNSLGWVPVGEKNIITKAHKDIVYEINHKPALEFYREYLGEKITNKLPKIGIEFPLLVRRNGELFARAMLKVFKDGSIKVGGNLYENEEVFIGVGFVDKILECHIEKLENKNHELFLIFSCMARKRFLKDLAVKEVEPFGKISKTAGFFTHGEFYNNKFMNETFNLCAISENIYPDDNVKVDCFDEVTDTYSALLNILTKITKDLNKKNDKIKNLEKSLNIRENLIKRIEKIEKLTTFQIDKNNFEKIYTDKKMFFNELDEEQKEKFIEFIEGLNNNNNYLELKTINGKHYIIYATLFNEKVYGVALDITEVRKKDEMLLSQSRLAQMGEMINMIAHQWRQPINAISSVIIKLQLLNEMGGLKNEELINSLTFISDIIQNISKTIDEFLNFSKPVSKCETFEIINIIDNIMKIILVQLQNHNIKVEIDIKDFELTSYKKEIEHILLNLITNARDALDAQQTRDKYIFIRAYKKDDTVYIEIEDNAGGIKTEPIERVFEPYFSTKKNGTGLGLYICKKIATEKLNGDLTVKNTKEGAVFTLRLKDLSECI